MKNKFTDLEINKRINEVNATLKIEGLSLSEQAKKIGKLYLEDKITEKEAKQMILKLHGVDE
ncbi:MAG: antitoxin VbhA family protein [Clostridium sp.]|nr:antitoxin VbhA family protein [Clostridium sp.]